VYYTRALTADPAHANNLVNYASFLKNIRKDYDKAETYYTRVLTADPANANTLGNYASFLNNIRKDYDKAETYYTRALTADPAHANNLGKYAVFLENIRKDCDKAEMYYTRALTADPTHANNLGNFARLLLATGRTDEGLAMLDRALAVPAADLPPELTVELRMYETCHRLPEQWRAALSKLKALLLTEKITTGDWDFSGVIEAAKRRDHPAGEWLDPLAAVCAGTSDASVLDAWDAWKAA
jgi:Tfp pilus assembly protein PilF